jgi:hypothetical protein
MEMTKLRDVYHITEQNNGESKWTRIGIGFVNKDDSLNIILDALPIDGRLHIRKRKPKKENTQ